MENSSAARLIAIVFACFWAAIITTVLTLHLLAAVMPPKFAHKMTYYARTITASVALFLCSWYGVVMGIVLKIVGLSGLTQWSTARSFRWVGGLSLGIWFDVMEGEEHLQERPAVFVANHQTELDVLMLGGLFPRYCSVTAKKSLKYIPILGWFMALSQTVFVDRANRSSAMAAFENAAKHMRSERQSVFIFPEGTRSYTDKPILLPFKKGAFHLAVQAQVPVVPIVCANYNHVLNTKEKVFVKGRIGVKVLPAIPTKGLTAADVNDLTQRVRAGMLSCLEDMYEKHQQEQQKLAGKATFSNGAAIALPALNESGTGAAVDAAVSTGTEGNGDAAVVEKKKGKKDGKRK